MHAWFCSEICLLEDLESHIRYQECLKKKNTQAVSGRVETDQRPCWYWTFGLHNPRGFLFFRVTRFWCFATQETNAASETAEGPARWRGDERRRRRGLETEDPPQGQGSWSTEPLLSVSSGGAAHRSGERRPPDTREEVGRSLHQVSMEHGNRADSCLQSSTFRSALVTVPRSHVLGHPQTVTGHGPAPGRGHLCPHRLPRPLGLTSAQDSQRPLSLSQTACLCLLPPLWQMWEGHHCLKPPHFLPPLPLPLQTLSCSSPAEVMLPWHLLLRGPELTQERVPLTLSLIKRISL